MRNNPRESARDMLCGIFLFFGGLESQALKEIFPGNSLVQIALHPIPALIYILLGGWMAIAGFLELFPEKR